MKINLRQLEFELNLSGNQLEDLFNISKEDSDLLQNHLIKGVESMENDDTINFLNALKELRKVKGQITLNHVLYAKSLVSYTLGYMDGSQYKKGEVQCENTQQLVQNHLYHAQEN